ncbi:hypothetical protein HXX01_04940 [Candidatus Nomurabacteria bacterium]|nr:hypothetical protein [Candidatus Nomurabacteria bacterium]
MKQIKCLVVCEGSSDFSFIEGVITKLGKDLNVTSEAILLEPQFDTTTGRHLKFGYEGVKAWCNHKRIIKQTRGSDIVGTLLALSNADFLLIHLDADIADKIEINSNLFTGSIKDRRQWCRDALDNWLGFAKNELNNHYLIPTWQIETWLLSTFDEVDAPHVFTGKITDYEEICNVEELMLQLGYMEDLEKKGRLYKERELFSSNSKYVPRMLQMLDKVESSCEEFKRFKETIQMTMASK